MPTYEYRCPKGHEFEIFQRISDEPRAECPECGKEAERLLSAGAGLVFKGSGFYITDYRSDSYREAAKAEGKDGSGKADDKGAEGKKSERKGEEKSGKKGGDAGSASGAESGPAKGASGGKKSASDGSG